MGHLNQIIAICNQKGGVGKTTTAVSLAASLAAAEKKVLLVDLDPQGNASSGVDINKYNVKCSAYEVIVGDAQVVDAAVPSGLECLDILPSNVNLVGAEVELISAVSRETRLKEALQRVRERYDYIIIDCPPSLGLLTINAMTAADGVIVPVQCEYYALEGMADLMRTIDLVRDRLNPSLEIFGIVLTMFDGRNNLSHQVSNEVRKHFGEKVFGSVIPRNVRLSEAPSHGKPIILYDVKSVGAMRYLEMAQEFLERSASVKEEGDFDGSAKNSVGEGSVLTDTGCSEL